MEEHSCGFQYRAEAPYPEIRVEERNRRYGEMMLYNLGGGTSEMSAVALYFYDYLMTADLPEVSEVFRQIAMVEMHHLELFGQLARQLGMDPRLWSQQGGRMTWWSSGYLSYAPKLGPLLRIALREEQSTVQRYERQCRQIQDAGVTDCLQRILLDERLHVDIFRSLCETYAAPPRPLSGA